MKLFISYARDDKAWVYELWRALRDEAQHDAWIDRQLAPAQDWWNTILDGVLACECFIYIMTPKSVESIYCRAELEYALALNKPILPLMLKPCDIPVALKPIQYQVISDDLNMDKVLLRVEKGLSAVQHGILQGKYTAVSAPRPDLPTPEKKPEQVLEVFALAAEAVADNNIPLAETLFKQVMDADPKGYGVAAAKRLAEIRLEKRRSRDYLAIVQMAANPRLIKDARAAAIVFVETYGVDYDPHKILPGLLAVAATPAPDPTPDKPPVAKPKRGSIRQFRGWIIVLILVTGGSGWVISQWGRPAGSDPSSTGQPAVTQAAPTLPTMTSRPSVTQAVLAAPTAQSVSTLPPAPTATRPPTAPPPTPLPTPVSTVTANAQWTPQFKIFDGVEMALVPPGCFTMGSETGEDDEKPTTKICFDKPFWIDKTEVTQAQFKLLGGVKQGNFSYFGDNRPADSITWLEARDFCARRGARLPTEAEWEYAARGPSTLTYPWGNDFDSNKLVWYANSNRSTAHVGSRPSGVSWAGALDMSGNVLEWTSSLYRPYPYNAEDGRENSNEDKEARMLRGGSWNHSGHLLRAALRFRYNPTGVYDDVGFRCARSS